MLPEHLVERLAEKKRGRAGATARHRRASVAGCIIFGLSAIGVVGEVGERVSERVRVVERRVFSFDGRTLGMER